jgi:hypothetical protein
MDENEEFHDLYSSQSIIKMVKSRLKWARHVAQTGENKNAYRLFVGMPKGKRPLGRRCRGWIIIRLMWEQ